MGSTVPMSVLSRVTRLASRSMLTPATRRYAHDSFAALNIMKDPSRAPVEKVRNRVKRQILARKSIQTDHEQCLPEDEVVQNGILTLSICFCSAVRRRVSGVALGAPGRERYAGRTPARS